jgi:hypothetical protein
MSKRTWIIIGVIVLLIIIAVVIYNKRKAKSENEVTSSTENGTVTSSASLPENWLQQLAISRNQ